jgi:hypothetical protein
MLTDMLTTAALARKLGISRQSLAIWRLKGSGPPYYKAGSRVLYRVSDVEKWLEDRRHLSTSGDQADRNAEG